VYTCRRRRQCRGEENKPGRDNHRLAADDD